MSHDRPFGFNDLVLAVGVLKELNIPHGVVINRCSIGDNKIEDYCEKNGIPVLLRIPLDEKIARAYSRGEPLVYLAPVWKDKFRKLFSNIKEKAKV